jgi:hypothetical protein
MGSQFAGVSLHGGGAGWLAAAGATETGRPAECSLLVVAGWLSEFQFPLLYGTEEACLFRVSPAPNNSENVGVDRRPPPPRGAIGVVWLTQN